MPECDRDDPGHWRRRVLTVLMAISGVVYLAWRTTTFSPEAPVASAVFYVGEVLGFLSSLLLFFVVTRQGARSPLPAQSGLEVDVFVTTYNEDMDVVRRTVVAALAIRYPHETWLLDDGNRPAFAGLAQELGCRYLARTVNTGAKAGNLNNALRHATGEFVAIFDADHCAEPQFLDRLLGYFRDPSVAFVQTPQDYYNLGSFQHGGDRDSRIIWHEQSGFHHVEQPGRDHHNAATLCGCSAVMRRAHLDLIGGFPEETVTEDMHAAVRLQKLGLSSVYHREPLAYGIAPPDFEGFIRQRLRWGEGNMQVCRAEGIPFSRALTWRQNLCYMLLSLVYVDAWRKLVLFLAPPLTILAQVPPVNGEPATFAMFFLPYLTFGLAAYFAHYGWFARFLATEIFAMARLSSGLLATWGLVRRHIPFRVSSKSLSGQLTWIYLLPPFLILAISLLAIGHTGVRFYDADAALTASLPLWIELVLASFCVYHAALALHVMALAVRCAWSPEANYEHPLRLPFDVASPEGVIRTCWTRRVSIDRMVSSGPTPVKDDELARVRLYLPGRTIDVAARSFHNAKSGETELRFEWPQLADRDVLDQLLHARRWHRFVEGRTEFVPTRWRGRFASSGVGVEGTAWEPVVAANRYGIRRLAYCSAHTGEPQMIGFGDGGPSGGPLTILASFSGHFIGAKLTPLHSASPPLADEGALQAVTGHRCHAGLELHRDAIVPASRPEGETPPVRHRRDRRLAA